MAQSLSLFDISGRAMAAQMIRLNTTASNLANARTTYATEAEAYRAIKPVFKTIEESPGVALARVLGAAGYGVDIYDPIALAAAADALNGIARPECALSRRALPAGPGESKRSRVGAALPR